MPANKYALLRYRIIHRCLANRYRPYPDKSYLRQQCEEALYGSSDGNRISEKTIERDLRDMREDPLLGYYAPINYNRQEKGYFYGDPDFDMDNKPLSAEEADALAFAANTLFQFKETGMFQPYAFAIEKIFEQLQFGNPQDVASDSIVQFETVPFFRGSHFLKPIFQAIRQRKVIRFRHQKYQDEHQTDRRMDPYLLKEFRNRWYMIGRVHEKSRIQSFGLDRLHHIEILDDSFDRDPDFNPDIYFRHTLGITEAGLQPETVVLSFSPLQGHYLKTQPIHQSQQILIDNREEFRISIRVLKTFELIQLILGYGPEVKVMEPPGIKEEITARLEKAFQQYDNSNGGLCTEEK